MRSLPPCILSDEEFCAVASLALHLLQDGSVLDAVSSRTNIDLSLVARLREHLSSHDFADFDIPTSGASAYDDGRATKRDAGKSHNIDVLIRCFTKRTLSGLQVYEGLLECPKDDLAVWITEHFMSWQPRVPRKRKSQA